MQDTQSQTQINPKQELIHVLRDAADRRASYIHFTGGSSFENWDRVRFRIDGNIKHWRTDLAITSEHIETICGILAQSFETAHTQRKWTKKDYSHGQITQNESTSLGALPQEIRIAKIQLMPLAEGSCYGVVHLEYNANAAQKSENTSN